MKKIIFLLIASILVSTNIFADTNVEALCEPCCCSESESMCQETENKYYGKFFFGTNYTDKHRIKYYRSPKNTLGSIYSGSLGYNVYPFLSVEAEYALRTNYIGGYFHYGFRSDKFYFETRVSSYMVNVIGNLPICILSDYNIKPFIGGGIGADYRTGVGAYFSWQILSGIKYSLTNKIDLSLEYRFHKGVCNKVPQFHHHSAGIGIAYNFN